MDQLLAWLPSLLLVSGRIAGVTATSPVFANRFMPNPLRVLFTFLLAGILLPVTGPAPTNLQGTALLMGCLLEGIVGLVIGFSGQLVFSAVQMAGALIDVDLGFSMAQIMDPVSGRSDPILSSLFQTVAVVVYFTLDAHHWLLRALADSYAVLPMANFLVGSTGPLNTVSLFGTCLLAAVKMVLPMVGVMLVTTVVLAGITRAVPQLNLFAVGMGAKSLIGFLVLIVLLPYFAGFLESLFSMGHSQLLQSLQLYR